MKKIAALALALTLGGTGAPAHAEPSQGVFTSADTAYLTDLAEQTGTINGTPRAKVELGIATCGALRTNPVQRVVDTGLRAQISGYDVGVLIAAASRNYCPDTWSRVIDWIEHV